MTQALLIFNPEATTVTPRVRDVIAHALDDVVSLEVAETKGRDHATEIARNAVAAGTEVVFCLGGDGTLNETLNGLAGSRVPLAVLPGGGTNVFARTLGIPRDPIEATSVFIERLREGVPPRRIPLGVMNGRRFSFCAGVGFDAEVVREVHRRFTSKQRWGEPFFITTAIRMFFTRTDRRTPALTVQLSDGRRVDDAFLAIVGKSDPFTFFRSRPLRLTPNARLEGGLDTTILTSMKTRHVVRIVAAAFGRGGHVRSKRIVAGFDLDGLTIDASRPVALQVDGEDVGEATHVEFALERGALSVL